ncbi:MAG: phosphoribosylglycinamide formyltransferase, partial [Bacteroidetes bacterium]|nr:phosphoribosylglycinamide formyltransferase [Bacteroidota bacterium]
MKHKIAIFGSGAGSNAEKIINYFNKSEQKNSVVSLIVSSNPDAGIIKISEKNNIPCIIINKKDFNSGIYNATIKSLADFIVLAGFLWQIPSSLIKEFPEKIINIHPALLPLYGGKGMYGHRVQEAVVSAGERKSGITVHVVNENYDEGKIIFQADCAIEENETA